MLIIKFIRWMYKTLNGVERPWQIALGVVLGLMFGLVPFGLLTFSGMLLLLFVNCHFGSGLFGMALGFALQPLLGASVADPLGAAVLEAGPHGLFTWLSTARGWSFLRLHTIPVMGGLTLGVIVGIPLFFLIRIGVRKFREPLYHKFGKSRWIGALTNNFVARGLKWLVVG